MDEQLLGELRKWIELPRVSVINPKQAKQLIGTVKALRAIALHRSRQVIWQLRLRLTRSLSTT